jgi:hypothetical protein
MQTRRRYQPLDCPLAHADSRGPRTATAAPVWSWVAAAAGAVAGAVAGAEVVAVVAACH